MNPQIKKLFIILLVLILLVGIFFGWWWWQNREQPLPEPPVVIPQPVTTIIPDQQVQETLSQQIAGKSEQEIGDYASIVNTSRYFVERFGSFSTGAAWQNIEDIQTVVTPQVYADLESLRASINQTQDNYILSTKSLSVNVQSQTENSATVLVQTQKREISGDSERIFYQDITLQLVKQSDTWLIADYNLGAEKK
jgi:hypothetical protein